MTRLGHPASEWQSQDSNPCQLDSEVLVLSRTLRQFGLSIVFFPENQRSSQASLLLPFPYFKKTKKM